jgi:hypothetical protein
MEDGDGAILPSQNTDRVVNIAHSRKFNEWNQSVAPRLADVIIERIRQLGGSFLPRYALISQKAFDSRPVHQGTAFLAGHAVNGSFRHGDFIFGSAGTFMRSGQPFHEFGHE